MALNYITTANTNNQGRLIVNEMLTYLATGATAGVDAGTFQLETFGGTPITGETRLAGNYIIDGMTVRKDSTNNLKFNIYPGSYLLNGTVYSFNGGSVTLNSNATAYDRIDLIYATNSSTVTKTTGTAASPTLSPSYTETTQLPLSFVIVQSGATAGSGGVGQIGGGSGNRVASTGETVSLGVFGEATGDRSINLGQFGKVSGKNSINLGGKYNYITADNVTLIGGENVTATTANEIVIASPLKFDASSKGIVIGPSNTSIDDRVFIMGQNNVTDVLNQGIARIILGDSNVSTGGDDFNFILGNSNSVGNGDSDPKFIFGSNNTLTSEVIGVFAADNCTIDTITYSYNAIVASYNCKITGNTFENLIAASEECTVNGQNSVIIGSQYSFCDGANSSIIGGSGNYIESGDANAHIIGGVNYSSQTGNSVIVPTIDIREGLRRDYAYNNSSTAVTLNTTSKSVQLFNTSARKYWVTLPNTTGVDSMVVTLKALGDAGTNNVVISGFTGESIDGNPDYTLNTNYQTVTLLWASDISYWLSI